MKKLLPAFLRSFLCSGILLLMGYSSYATHIVAAELRYKWISGLTYQVTVYLYGDCGPASAGSFATLPSSNPQVCIFDGTTATGSVSCSIVAPSAGTEVTPVCPDSLAYTQCSIPSSSLAGIKKFVYTGTTTLPHISANWRFVYEGNNPGGASAGRAGAITNINTGGGSTYIQLIDTLNNSATNTRGNNSSPVLTVEPIPFFCNDTTNKSCYNPGAVDLYDVSTSEPSGDSLVFQLIPATNGTGACGTVGGVATYIVPQCSGGPLANGSEPLQLISCAPGNFSFDPTTGQMCFKPIIQRAVVVYNIEEYRDDTVSTTPLVVNKVLVGTMQREMTYNVIPCSQTTPRAFVDSISGPAVVRVDSYRVFTCANSGTFSLASHPTDADTSLHIDVTATGLSTGFTFSVTGNGTSSPIAVLTGNTALIAPGHYIIYVNFTDDHCPLEGSATYPFIVDVLPVPTIRDTIIQQATCSDSAVVKFIPGGTGKPWTVKLSYNPSRPGVDTFKIFTDTTSFTTNLAPGSYYMTIFTSVSNNCHVGVPFAVDTPRFAITDTFFKNPTYCGARDGEIYVAGLNPSVADTLFLYQGARFTRLPFVSSAAGTDTLTNLLAGVYDSIIVQQGLCRTKPATPHPLTLVNPPFIWRTVTTRNASRCGFCDGSDTLFGIHPGQLDTIQYTVTPFPPGIPTATTVTESHVIGTDSMIVFNGLCAGTYTSFVINTAGVCRYALPGSFTIGQPQLHAQFDDTIHYGCAGDTVFFVNTTYTDSVKDTALNYRWAFGDGSTSIARNPEHLYNPTNGTSFTAHLYITNSVCKDSAQQTFTLDNYIAPSFTFTPSPYVCQLSPVTFTNSSTGTNLSYMWYFGDGTTDNTASPVHTFTNTGTYHIKLVASDFVAAKYFSPCYDTAYGTIAVDSISAASIATNDTVICRGETISFNGIFSHLGDTLVGWNFGDSAASFNLNPVVHSYDGTGYFNVTLDVKYRACPETTATKKILVFPVPNLYLGSDTSICPGGNAIMLSDSRNVPAPNSSWKWSTGETGPAIMVTKPGSYYATLTSNGCSASDTIEVFKDCYMDIPNVFSPNGDGVNDYFFPRQILTRGVVAFKMEIYNRWGQSVYETESTDGRGWDGSYNGKPQPEGVYVYLIDAKFKDGQIEHHQGNITLLR